MLATDGVPPTPPIPGGLEWIEAALLIFFVVFVGIVLVVVFARRGKYDAAARIPLEEDVVTPRNGVPASSPAPPAPTPRNESTS